MSVQINIMETLHISVKVVTLLVMVVLQQDMITVIHVRMIIMIRQEHVYFVTVPVMDVLQQDLITVMHV